MIESMTGYGRGEYLDEKYHFIVECKSVNNRYLDLNMRIPRKISYLEDFIRHIVKKYISRGKVDLFIKLELNQIGDIKITYDKNIVKEYINVLNDIEKEFGILNETNVIDIAKFQDVIKIDENQLDENEIKNSLSFALEDSLKKLKNMRQNEGEELKNDILSRCVLLKEAIIEIESLSKDVEIEYREKLFNKIKDLFDNLGYKIDEQRILQEAAILADKSSIDEEITRFKTHIYQLESILDNDTVGRKMDFLIQEMNREINTIGSKTTKIEVTNLVVNIKSELEKIREQIQNIE